MKSEIKIKERLLRKAKEHGTDRECLEKFIDQEGWKQGLKAYTVWKNKPGSMRAANHKIHELRASILFFVRWFSKPASLVGTTPKEIWIELQNVGWNVNTDHPPTELFVATYDALEKGGLVLKWRNDNEPRFSVGPKNILPRLTVPVISKTSVEFAVKGKYFLPQDIKRKWQKVLKGRGNLKPEVLQKVRAEVCEYFDEGGFDFGSMTASDFAIDQRIEENPYLYRVLVELEADGLLQPLIINDYRDIFWFTPTTYSSIAQ